MIIATLPARFALECKDATQHLAQSLRHTFAKLKESIEADHLSIQKDRNRHEIRINTADELIKATQSFLDEHPLSDQEAKASFFRVNDKLQRRLGQIVHGALFNVNYEKVLEDAIKVYGIYAGDESERALRHRIALAQNLPHDLIVATNFEIV